MLPWDETMLQIALLAATTPTAPAPASNTIFDFIGPIAGTGLVGVFFLMIVLKIKIMPTYVHEDAKKDWDKDRERLVTENDELKVGLKEASLVYTQQVIPTLTRVLDAERELVDLRRDEAAERRRRAEPERS